MGRGLYIKRRQFNVKFLSTKECDVISISLAWFSIYLDDSMLGPEIKTGLSEIKPFLFIIISKLCDSAHV